MDKMPVGFSYRLYGSQKNICCILNSKGKAFTVSLKGVSSYYWDASRCAGWKGIKVIGPSWLLHW